MISIIAAVAKNGIIGNKNSLPWNLKEDMKRFKKITMGKPVIMGRRTFESIGKPLPNRENIILTRKKNKKILESKVFNSVEKVLNYVKGEEEAMVIGGASIYKQFLPFTKKMYLTVINKEFEGDSYFPKYNKKEWEIIENKEIKPKSKSFSYNFITLIRK